MGCGRGDEGGGVTPCKICGGNAPLAWVTDFSRTCREREGFFTPLSGQPVYYRRCEVCGFAFTNDFDAWTPDDFRLRVYNDDYALIDPDHTERRPSEYAKTIRRAFGDAICSLSMLDYGGRDGELASRLTGFASAATYDPMVPEHSYRPDAAFDLVTCLETLEHCPDPMATARDIAALTRPDGLVIASTLCFPTELAHDDRNFGAVWWYAAPRNGHISLFTRDALTRMWNEVGMQCVMFSDSSHIAFREIPAWAAHLLAPAYAKCA